jgi:hypothetical protein
MRSWLPSVACGWILFLPPTTPVDNHQATLKAHVEAVLAQSLVDVRAPFSQWEQARAFDSADACENFKTRVSTMFKETSGRLLQYVEEHPTADSVQAVETTAQGMAAFVRVEAGRCLPATVVVR